MRFTKLCELGGEIMKTYAVEMPEPRRNWESHFSWRERTNGSRHWMGAIRSDEIMTAKRGHEKSGCPARITAWVSTHYAIRPLIRSQWIGGVPLKCSISTQEQNCGPAEEYTKRLIHPDKYCLGQYLVDGPDPELRRILCLIRHQIVD
jgi:hypothetical protein